MRFVIAQIFTIDGHGADDVALQHGQPDVIALGVKSGRKLRQPAGDLTFEKVAEPVVPGIIFAVHLRDAANHTRPVSAHNRHVVCRGGPGDIAAFRQRLRVRGQPQRHVLLFSSIEMRERINDPHRPVIVNPADRPPTLFRQFESLKAGIFAVGFFLQLAGGQQTGQHTADARFLQPQDLNQLCGGHRPVGGNLQQRMHGGG